MDVQVEDQFSSPVAPALSYAVDGIIERRALLQALLVMISRLVPCDSIAWNYVDLVTGAVVVEGIPAERFDSQPGLWSLVVTVGDHPMITSYLDNPLDLSPRRMSDIVSTADLHKTRAYAEVLRPTRSERQMTVVPGADVRGGGGRSFTLARETRDFTDDELRLLGEIQPVLAALDAQLSRIDPSIPPEEVVRARTQPPPSTHGDGRAELLLTGREAEILSLVARGLTATSCAHLLRISEGTVRKHLENAYAKLGCHDRMGAVQRARQLRLLR